MYRRGSFYCGREEIRVRYVWTGDISTTASLKIIEQAFVFNKYRMAAANSVIYAALVIVVLAILKKGADEE